MIRINYHSFKAGQSEESGEGGQESVGEEVARVMKLARVIREALKKKIARIILAMVARVAR